MEDVQKLVEEAMAVATSLPQANAETLARMINVLQAEFPGLEGFNIVMGQLPHLFNLMLEGSKEIAN